MDSYTDCHNFSPLILDTLTGVVTKVVTAVDVQTLYIFFVRLERKILDTILRTVCPFYYYCYCYDYYYYYFNVKSH